MLIEISILLTTLLPAVLCTIIGCLITYRLTIIYNSRESVNVINLYSKNLSLQKQVNELEKLREASDALNIPIITAIQGETNNNSSSFICKAILQEDSWSAIRCLNIFRAEYLKDECEEKFRGGPHANHDKAGCVVIYCNDGERYCINMDYNRGMEILRLFLNNDMVDLTTFDNTYCRTWTRDLFWRKNI